MTNSYNNRLRVKVDVQQPTGVWTNQFGYDAAKRLTNVTSQAGAYGYALGGGSAASALLRKLSLPNTAYVTNTYDSVARLLSTTLKNSSHTTLNAHTYTYNPANQRTQQLFNAGSTVNYTYDRIGQLKVADSGTASEDRGYAYDKAWNLSYRTNNTTLNTFTVDGKNQLTTSTPSGANNYDYNGNLISSGGGALWFYYDAENQLTQVTSNNVAGFITQWQTFLAYDGRQRLRLRIERAPAALAGGPAAPGGGVVPLSAGWVTNSVTEYIYDGMRVIQERNQYNTPTVSYTRGTDLSGSMEGSGGIGGLLGRSHGYSAGNWSKHNFYHADRNGNVTYLVNSSQTRSASYRYDPYGNALIASELLSYLGGIPNTYRFSSIRPPIGGPLGAIICLIINPTAIGPEPEPPHLTTFDPMIRDHIEDMKDCFAQAHEQDLYNIRTGRSPMTDEEFDDYVELCIKGKTYKGFKLK